MKDVARLLELRDRLPNEWAGLLTRSAQALAAVQAESGGQERCRGCGAQLPPQSRGRPRKWCSAPECQRRRKNGSKNPAKKEYGGRMSSIVDQEELNRFLEHADVREARKIAAALDAMAAACRLAVVELETRSEDGGPLRSSGRRPRRGAS